MEERKPVQVGIDLRPIPLALSDGEVWPFNPDPDKSFFSTMAELSKQMQTEGDSQWDAVDGMRELLAAQITEPDRQDHFRKKEYGVAVLGALAGAYAETVVAIPTQSSSPSGPGRKNTGGKR